MAFEVTNITNGYISLSDLNDRHRFTIAPGFTVDLENLIAPEKIANSNDLRSCLLAGYLTSSSPIPGSEDATTLTAAFPGVPPITVSVSTALGGGFNLRGAAFHCIDGNGIIGTVTVTRTNAGVEDLVIKSQAFAGAAQNWVWVPDPVIPIIADREVMLTVPKGAGTTANITLEIYTC